MLKLCLISLIGLFFIIFFKGLKPEISLLVKLATVLLLAYFLLEGAENAITALFALSDTMDVDAVLLETLLKALGICILSQITANICKDCGETALSTGVEMAGRMAVLIMALPIASELIRMCLGWIKA